MFTPRNNLLIPRQTYCILCVYTSILLNFFIAVSPKKRKESLIQTLFYPLFLKQHLICIFPFRLFSFCCPIIHIQAAFIAAFHQYQTALFCQIETIFGPAFPCIQSGFFHRCIFQHIRQCDRFLPQQVNVFCKFHRHTVFCTFPANGKEILGVHSCFRLQFQHGTE